MLPKVTLDFMTWLFRSRKLWLFL